MKSRRCRRLGGAIASVTLGVVTCLPSNSVEAAPVTYVGATGAPRISVIGDSVMSGIRWYGAWAPLRRFNYTVDVESCRRTLAFSCRGREGYAPDNTISAMRRLRGQLGSVLVVGTGYNDPGVTFARAVDAVMAEAAAQGIPVVIWATMRTAGVSYVSPTYASSVSTFRNNNQILLAKAAQYGGRLQVADWATYSASRREWVGSDGVHLTPSGATAMAGFIADQAAIALGQISTPTGLTAYVAPVSGVGAGPAVVETTDVHRWPTGDRLSNSALLRRGSNMVELRRWGVAEPVVLGVGSDEWACLPVPGGRVHVGRVGSVQRDGHRDTARRQGVGTDGSDREGGADEWGRCWSGAAVVEFAGVHRWSGGHGLRDSTFLGRGSDVESLR